MSMVKPLSPEELPGIEPILSHMKQAVGYYPNSLLIMGRRPGVVEAFVGLAGAVTESRSIDPELAAMVGYMVSHAAGCRYCEAHTHHAASHSISPPKLAAIWEYQSSAHFTKAERAALDFARAAGQTPSGVAAEQMDKLKAHYNDDEIVDIVLQIALFGFLNRWNDAMGTPLEEAPLQHALQDLSKAGWTPDKHRS